MKRFLGLLSVFLMAATVGYGANTGTVTGVLIDDSNGEPVIGAVITVSDINGKLADKFYSTEVGGKINIKSLPYGKYKFTFAFLGFSNLETEVTLNTGSINLGTLRMKASSMNIETVVFEAPAIRTSQKGDTVIYNASAFKVSADAVAEGLIAKMPGIMISPDGTVEAQGEQVKKIFVDGKEFFGDDVSTAIKNLPAEVVESVQVFNKLSDKAELTGLDDGEGYKALNIVTSEAKRKGVFGKLYAAYGYPEYYTGGGNVNIFNGDSRISILGLANNINQQNFSFEDILGVVNTSGSSSGGGRMGRNRGGGVGGFMVRPMDGISTVQAIGVNYSDTWGKRDKVTFSGSYFFNHNKTRNKYTNELWQNDQNLTDQQYDYQTGSSTADNYNHRLNARIEYKINDNNNIMIRPWLSYQSYSGLSNSRTDIDSLKSDLTLPIKSIINGENSTQYGYYGGLSALYNHKFAKQGRTLTVNLDGTYTNSVNAALLEEYTYKNRYLTGARPDSVGSNNRFEDSYSYRLRGGFTYTEPLSKTSQINLEYRINYDYSDADTRVYLWNPLLELIDPEFSEKLSTINNSGYLTQRVGPGYQYANGKVNISASVVYQYSTLDSDILYPVHTNPNMTHSFNNIVYFGMANVNFDQQNSLRVFAHSRTSNPSVSQLQDVPDFSNSTSIAIGNPSLQPTYTNNLMMHYVKSNVGKGRTFTIMAGAQYTTNYIGGDVVTYNSSRPTLIPGTENQYLTEGQRYTRYANMGDSWYVNGGVSYGIPVKFLSSNLNFNLGATLGQTPSIMNGLKYIRSESYYNGGVQLSSNISENIDFTLSYDGSYNIASSTVGSRKSQDKFINQYASASIKWVIWKGFTFTGNASYNQYRGITSDYNEEYVLCNLYIGKKIFRNQLGEISVGVNDLFDQNTSFRRTVTSSSIENNTNLAIGRYFSVQFVYNLRLFGKGSGKSASEYDNFDAQSSGSVGVKSNSSASQGHRGMMGGGRPPKR